MEALTRLVTESLVRHGFDRPPDYRRLQWSRWFRCESLHSLLYVPSKPGVFALAEEVADLSAPVAADAFLRQAHVGTAAPGCPAEQRSAPASSQTTPVAIPNREGHDFSLEPALSKRSAPKGAIETPKNPADLAAEGSRVLARSPEAESRKPEAGLWKPEAAPRRLLAVTQFFEDDDMAFVLDRMLSRENPLRARLLSGRYFVRFVVIEDPTQRRGICNALNQWMASSAEKASGIGGHFATSLELNPTTEYIPQPDDRQQNLFDDNGENPGRALGSATAGANDAHAGINTHVDIDAHAGANAHVETAASAVPRSEASAPFTKMGLSPSTSIPTSPHLDSGAASNIHCPSSLPSGF